MAAYDRKTETKIVFFSIFRI